MSIFSDPLVWPPLEKELAPFLKYCQGIVLNAGSGKRGIQLGEKSLHIDIVQSNSPDIVGDLHCIPLIDESVDTVVSIAVLEHTHYPWIVTQEFYRVLRAGGYGVIAVPFMQPQHACPNDFVRFTENGLVDLMKYVGFEVVEVSHVHHFGQTLAWLLWEYLEHNKPSKWTRHLWMILIHQLSRGNLIKGDSPNTHNTHYIVVRKPGYKVEARLHQQVIDNEDPSSWFYPLLACPQTKQQLHIKDNLMVSQNNQFSYSFADGIPQLIPTQELQLTQ